MYVRADFALNYILEMNDNPYNFLAC